jgi:hypothetical protein
MKKMQEKVKYTIYKIKRQLTPQISKARSIEGFGEDIVQLSLCAYVSHLNISLLNVIS